MDSISKIYLLRKFREYYSKADIKPPPNFEKREWAFVPLEILPDFFMHRHISFKSFEEFKASIINSPPAHVYYSSACYEKPDEVMEKKGWLYADLIFDIDADHIPAKSKDMDELIDIAKKEIVRLSELLSKDFGVSDSEMRIVFSGGRGYHLHVYDEGLSILGSAERREIVDYILLTQPDMYADSLQSRRLRVCFISFLRNLMKKDKLKEYLKSLGIRKTDIIESDLRRLVEDSRAFIRGDYRIEDKVRSKSKKLNSMIEQIVSSCISKLSIHIDAPVTADIKRLIRLPGSIHGKSGLKAMEVSLNDIEDFNPFRDALAFGDENVKITVLKSVKVKMNDEFFKLKSGERVDVPEYLAVHLICRGLARYGH
ncbi:DNA primase, eukaryotic-type, small subunit, putative [Archaeoglobus sulfaticallidus PM70-1]|uniref:DNA primase small subunit PriS n=1 Tax=Archaeoglobus sulfaticallidus PM70-1 TaxID=387631 RepID=N0BIM3_9EURY|nr:DNA primase catalytic subunit PriS [Archaeoglobus sulfaticallidus]AGK60321.1 DNA primase, eukaryotic-type, small subunit, putative [Archaeoglobus sulfaticallidus PM70-1]